MLPTSIRPLLAAALLLAGCSAQVSPGTDAGPDDAGPDDAGPAADAGPADAADAGPREANPADAGPADAGPGCLPTAGQHFPDFPAHPPAPDAKPPFACGPEAGRVTDLDALIAAMPAGSWKELPCTQLANVCPAPYEHYRCAAVMSAWSGAAFDPVGDRLLVFGGGHSDSYYNPVFAFDLATASWSRLGELPAGMTGDHLEPAFLDKRLETCGLYPRTPDLCVPDAWLTPTGYLDPARCDDPGIAAQLDSQQPRSAHTYGNLAASGGRLYVLGSVGVFPSGQAATRRVRAFDPATRRWSAGADNPGTSYGTSATDAAGRIWYLSSGGGKLLAYDPAADRWTAQDSEARHAYYGAADVDTARNVLVATADGLSLATYALGVPGAPLTEVTATGLAAALPGAPGMAYAAPLDRFVAWNGGRTLSFLDPATWRWTTVTGSGDDPGPKAANGTFGRFRYSPHRGVFVAVSATEADVFLYKPPASPP